MFGVAYGLMLLQFYKVHMHLDRRQAHRVDVGVRGKYGTVTKAKGCELVVPG